MSAPQLPTTDRAGVVTRLLRDADGEGDLVERLLPHVYEELRGIARSQRRRRGAPDTLMTTALVHEAYLRLVGRDMVPNRAYFFAAAARAMRNVLVDHARRRVRRPRGHGETLNPDVHQGTEGLDAEAAYLLDVHSALDRLAGFDERAARVVECRFFGGLTMEDAAEAVGVSKPTAKRDWRRARAWLHTQLGEAPEAASDATILLASDG